MDPRTLNAVFRFLPYLRPSQEEVGFLAGLGGTDRSYRPGDIIGEGGAGRFALLLDGWALAALVTTQGEKRVHTVHLPGDMLQMPEQVLGEPLGWSEALTDAVVREFDGAQIWKFFTQQPRLAAAMYLIAQEERASRIEWYSLGVSMGAKRRLAALLYRLGERMEKYDWLAQPFDVVPLRQKDFAALIGVTPVYVSRIIGQLIDAKLIGNVGSGVRILDLAGLRAIAGLEKWRVKAPGWVPSE
jgi:CRP/FNR family transcriptional regulator, anaerobic regulatory protein